MVTVPDQLGAVAGALLQAVVAAGAGSLLAKQLEERFESISCIHLRYFSSKKNNRKTEPKNLEFSVFTLFMSPGWWRMKKMKRMG